MKVFICTGHANYGNGIISSADGRSSGGCNEYLYNAELIKYVGKWLKIGGCDVTAVVPPDGKLHSLADEINYYIGEENKSAYDLSVQLHLNSFNSLAQGAEVWYYSDRTTASRICQRLGDVWYNRGSKKSTSLYWLNNTKSPAVLIESFFCDSKEDYKKAQELGMDEHGKLIAEGILGRDLSSPTKYKITAIKEVKSKKTANKLVQELEDNGYTIKVERS